MVKIPVHVMRGSNPRCEYSLEIDLLNIVATTTINVTTTMTFPLSVIVIWTLVTELVNVKLPWRHCGLGYIEDLVGSNPTKSVY